MRERVNPDLESKVNLMEDRFFCPTDVILQRLDQALSLVHFSKEKIASFDSLAEVIAELAWAFARMYCLELYRTGKIWTSSIKVYFDCVCIKHNNSIYCFYNPNTADEELIISKAFPPYREEPYDYEW